MRIIKLNKIFMMMYSVIIILALFSLLSCATFSKNAYRSLSVAGETYDIAMTTAANLYLTGQIDEEEKTKVIVIAKEYKKHYDIAVDMLALYQMTHDADTEQQFIQAISDLTPILYELELMINTLSHKN